MSVVRELVEAIEADPWDNEAQMVIADYLQAEGDPRGDLIVLDHAERMGKLDDPAALDQLLMLAAQYSFPRAATEEPRLPFVQLGFTHYEVVHSNYHYALGYSLRIRHVDDVDGEETEHHSFPFARDAWHTHGDVILQIISDVIRAKTPIDTIRVKPFGGLEFPQYEGSPLRCYALPVEYLRAHDLFRNQYGLAARDYHRWHAIWKKRRP